MTNATKKGARHNQNDQKRIDDSRVKLREIDQNLVDLGATEDAPSDTPNDTPPDAGAGSDAAAAKASDIPTPAGEYFAVGAVKAAGDWELDICYMPYGGQQAGKDAHGEYFSATTKEHADKFPSPLILYYHGYTPEGKPQGEPQIIGEATGKRWTDNAGRWMRVKLDRASDYARRMMDAAKRGLARVSSGSIAHLVRKQFDGHITNWPVVEISLIDSEGDRQPANQYAVALPAAKSHYQLAGIEFPVLEPIEPIGDETQPEDKAKGESAAKSEAATPVQPHQAPDGAKDISTMDEKDIAKLVADNVAAAFKAQQDLTVQEAKAKADEQARIDAAVKAELDKRDAEAAKSRRLPFDGKAPVQTKFADTRKYDNLKAADLAVAMQMLTAAKEGGIKGATGYDPIATKALAIKIAEDKDTQAGVDGRNAIKAAGFDPADFLSAATKANELDYSTQASYGDEWAGVLYSTNLWEAVRAPASIVGQLPSIEVPQGAESVVIPIESTDPTFYKVSQTTDQNATTGIPDATVTASKLATGNNTLTVAKGGARVGWSGELDEDSVIPFASQLRAQLEKAAAEQIESLVIDGDTVTSSSNINNANGSTLSTNLFLLFNGFRKSPLVTTTANSRSAGGLLADTDFLATAQLMGTAGLLGADRQKTAFIVDANTQWKASQLLAVKTRDVYSNPTLENGMLLGIWGYKVFTSFFMHLPSAKRMANTSGKIDVTDSSNTTGAILAVRFDQWMLGYKRRITMEVTRYPRSDSSEIVSLFRIGLKQRDTEASAITYNVGV